MSNACLGRSEARYRLDFRKDDSCKCESPPSLSLSLRSGLLLLAREDKGGRSRSPSHPLLLLSFTPSLIGTKRKDTRRNVGRGPIAILGPNSSTAVDWLCAEWSNP